MSVNQGRPERRGGRKTKDGHPIVASRFLASVRACLQEAWREELIDHNPAARIRKNPENAPRDRVLSNEELIRLRKVVAGYPEPHVKAAYVLLIETGARLGEVLKARWEHFDLENKLWKLPVTKAGKQQWVPLVDSTIEVLKATPRVGPYVVAGTISGKSRYDLRGPWNVIKQAAQLEGVNIHDIRRTFGLHVAVQSGLHVASKLLRHSDVSVTVRHYAPLGIEELRAAEERNRKWVGEIDQPGDGD
ncbi:site-specific integrase [bacterium]|nr:site-specific integrase [candidate division CSSED10-310 bacterium]